MRALGLGAAVLALAAAFVAVVTAGGRREPSASSVRSLGSTDPQAAVDFALTLRLRDDRLDRFLADQADPASPRYQATLGARAFGRRFGRSRDTLLRLERSLGAAGIAVTARYPQRTSLRVRGSAAAVLDLFGVTLQDFADGAGTRWHAPDGDAVIPPGLESAVTGVAGLDTRPLARHAAAVPSDGLDRAILESAYNLDRLHQAGYEGQGQTIAILGYDAFSEDDVAAYDRLTGTEAPPVERVDIGRGSPPGDAGERHLDIDVVRAVAPRAQILSYEAPNLVGAESEMINQMVEDERTDIASYSWGACDLPPFADSDDRAATQQALQGAVAQGVTIFNSSGDAGAYDCQHFDINDDRLAVDYPADTPNVVSVGGTRLSVRENGQYLEETGWEAVLSAGGGGGGLSPTEPRPEWQSAPGVDNDLSDGMRQVPDVAAAADPDSGYLVVDDGKKQIVGGTSGAAPFWAASMLLVKQYVEDKGGPGKLGFVGPALYAIAREEGADSPFNDVVRGGNRLYNAGPGWDYSTGLGSADMFELAQAFAQRAKG